jgi:hypothetical protein
MLIFITIFAIKYYTITSASYLIAHCPPKLEWCQVKSSWSHLLKYTTHSPCLLVYMCIYIYIYIYVYIYIYILKAWSLEQSPVSDSSDFQQFHSANIYRAITVYKSGDSNEKTTRDGNSRMFPESAHGPAQRWATYCFGFSAHRNASSLRAF